MTRTTSTVSTRGRARAGESVDRVRSEGGRNVMASAARHLCFNLVGWTAKWLSRTANAIRLLDLPTHRRRVRRSRRILRELRAIRGEAASARAFGYLRRIDPLVCEEVVLSALEDAGAFVLRNRRYSGDGGLDGRCWLPGARWGVHAVQVKRYDAAVAPAHLAALSKLVDEGGWSGGLFVHCGRTGPLSYAVLRGSRVALVSGDTLLRLLIEKQLPQGARLRHPPLPAQRAAALGTRDATPRARLGRWDAAPARQDRPPMRR